MTNPFKKAADEAKERGSNSVSRRILIEGAMAEALVKALTDRGYGVTVDDGEENVIVNSKDVRAIVSKMFQSDEDNVCAINDKGDVAAWFYLVYGNSGYDVISDFSANALGNEVWDKVLSPLSDELESSV